MTAFYSHTFNSFVFLPVFIGKQAIFSGKKVHKSLGALLENNLLT